MTIPDASPTKIFVWLIGLILVLGAVYVLWALTELRDLVPEGAVIAAILLILGIAVMGIASQFDGEGPRTAVYREGGGPAAPRRGGDVDEARARDRDYPDNRRY